MADPYREENDMGFVTNKDLNEQRELVQTYAEGVGHRDADTSRAEIQALVYVGDCIRGVIEAIESSTAYLTDALANNQ